MRLPPLKLHMYGIRLKLVITVLFLGIILALPYFYSHLTNDLFILYILTLIIVSFGLGHHEFHTTSVSYLSLRNNRKKFYLSSLLFGIVFALLITAICYTYFFVWDLDYANYQHGHLNFVLIGYSFIVFFLIYLLGANFAIIIQKNLFRNIIMALIIILISIFHKEIWLKRASLTNLILFKPFPFLEHLSYFRSIFVFQTLFISIITVILIILSYTIYLTRH